MAHSGTDTPGPALYDYKEALHVASNVFGTSRRDSGVKPYPYPDLGLGDTELDEHAADVAELRFPSARRTVFGTEERFPATGGVAVRTPDLVRMCPDMLYARESPGPIYDPDDRPSRPSSAPAYSMGSSRRGAGPGPGIRATGDTEHYDTRNCGSARSYRNSSTARGSAPSICQHEVAFGRQRDSRRRTGRASSFSRSSRFPEQKQGDGGLTEECKELESSFGCRATVARRGRRASSATFGTSTREGATRVAVCRSAADRLPSAGMCPPRMPHPKVAPRQELLRHHPPVRQP